MCSAPRSLPENRRSITACGPEDGKRRQVGQAQRFAADVELGTTDPAHREFAQVEIGDVGAGHRLGLQHDVEVTLAELFAQVDGGVAGDLDLQAREHLVHASEEIREPAMHDRFDHADADHAGVNLLVGHVVLHLAHQLDHALGIHQRLAAVRGQRHFARAAVEQAHAEILLQRGDAARHRRLRGVQALGGQAEIFQLGEPDEGFEETDVHGKVGSHDERAW